MKKVVIAIFLLSIALSSLGQVMVSNSHSEFAVEVKVKGKSFLLGPNIQHQTNLFSANQDNEYEIKWTVNDKVVTKKFKEFVAEKLIINVNREPKVASQKENTPPPSANTRIRQSYGQEELRIIKNGSSRRFQIRDASYGLNGLSLAPEQSSASVMIPQGLIQFSLLVDLDPDTLSTGRNYSTEVFTQIIAQEQDTIIITDRHIYVPISGNRVRVTFVNSTEYDIVGVGGSVGSISIRSGRYRTKKIDLNEGFINTTWQVKKGDTKIQFIPEYTAIGNKARVIIREIE